MQVSETWLSIFVSNHLSLLLQDDIQEHVWSQNRVVCLKAREILFQCHLVSEQLSLEKTSWQTSQCRHGAVGNILTVGSVSAYFLSMIFVGPFLIRMFHDSYSSMVLGIPMTESFPWKSCSPKGECKGNSLVLSEWTLPGLTYILPGQHEGMRVRIECLVSFVTLFL